MKRAAAERVSHTRSSSSPLGHERLMTLEEWADLDEDVEGELVDGVLEEEEMATILHELVVAFLLRALFPWVQKRRGLVTGSEVKIAVGPRRGRKPDLSVFLAASRPGLMDSLVRIAPHLVVEVVSERPRDARRDRIDKLHDYAAAGVRWYWIVDPQLRTLEILSLDPRKKYVHALDATHGRLKTVPGCAGLHVDLDALWSELDAAAESDTARRRRTARSRVK
jgi:Uma2 family endonuclease